MSKKIKKISTLILILIAFIYCNEKKERKIEKKSIKEICFEVGFTTLRKFRGIYYDKKDNEEYFYFADPVTHKKIKIFDLKGHFKYEIPLFEFSKKLISIDKILFSDKDSILVLGSNTVYLTDESGKIRNTTNLNRLSSKNDFYTYLLPQTTNFTDNYKSLLFNCDWRYNLNKEYKYYYEDCFYKSRFVKIKNIFDSKKIEYKFSDNFYSNISKEPKNYFELLQFHIKDNKIYTMSCYSEYLFIYDFNTLKPLKKIKIISNSTDISIKPTNANIDMDSEAYHKLFANYGFINNIKINNQNIYLTFNLNVKGEDINISERPFTILKYDNNFKKINEITFYDKTYCGSSVKLIKQGLLLENLKKSTNEKTFYTLFDY